MGSETNDLDTREEDKHRNNGTLREFEEEEEIKRLEREDEEMDAEQFINEQVGRKLLIYNEDLNKKKGNHHLKYFSWAILGCAFLFFALQLTRCTGRG